MKTFQLIKYWIFDLDNTLYSGKTKVFEQVDIPLIVGGGIRTPEAAREKVESGASFVVTGTIIEENNNGNILEKFAEAVHVNEK